MQKKGNMYDEKICKKSSKRMSYSDVSILTDMCEYGIRR